MSEEGNRGVERTRQVTGKVIFQQCMTITDVTATDRKQGPVSPRLHSVTLYTPAANLGRVYYGGPDVTNKNGINPGRAIAADGEIENVFVENTKIIWFAADNANDKVCFIGVG